MEARLRLRQHRPADMPSHDTRSSACAGIEYRVSPGLLATRVPGRRVCGSFGKCAGFVELFNIIFHAAGMNYTTTRLDL